MNDVVSEIESMAVDEHKPDEKEPMAEEDELSPHETPSDKEVSNTGDRRWRRRSAAKEPVRWCTGSEIWWKKAEGKLLQLGEIVQVREKGRMFPGGMYA